MAFIEYKKIGIEKPGHIRSLLVCYCMDNMEGMTPYEQSFELTEHAISAGYVADRAPYYGLTLDNVIKKMSAPWWMSRAALDILVMKKWVPDSGKQWASFTNAWLYANGPFNSLDDVLNSLPPHIKHEEASHWFKNISSRFNFSQATKPVSRVVDRNSEPSTLKFLSAENAKKQFLKNNECTWEEAEQVGFKIEHQHVLICNLLNDRQLDNSDRGYLIEYVKKTKMLSYISLPITPTLFKCQIYNLTARAFMFKRSYSRLNARYAS